MMKALALIFVTFPLQLSANVISDDAVRYLLPGNIIPVHYDLRLNTYIERFPERSYEYDGEIRVIMMPVEDNVKSVVINCHALNITSAVLTLKGSPPVNLGKGRVNSTEQKLIFELKGPLMKYETVMLNLTFVGQHSSQQVGFYRTTFTENGQTKTVLSTQFQPAYARSAFPCFDEPRYKATYKIEVTVSKEMISRGYRVLSNTAEERIEAIGDRRVYSFKKTPVPISSYLVAVLISDYKSSPPQYFNAYPEGNHKEFRTWGRETYIGQAKLAQGSGVALMDIYAKEYDVPYRFDKLDQAAVAEFPIGMENWGLIFYWEAILTTTEDSKQDTVTLIAHELSHQWFGNLVTCHYWSDIWLNEGFATYFEYYGADKLNIPEANANAWELPYQFVIKVQQSNAFQFDVPGYTHPLSIDVFDPSEIRSYFDRIAYHKGASVIRMWAHILGLDAFNQAVSLYLRKNKGGVSTPETLLSSFDAFANESASTMPDLPSKIFRCWHLQEGYPLVHVKRAVGPHPVYTLSQEVYRFRNSSREHNSTWNIPITYSTSKNIRFHDTRPTHWLREREDSSITLEDFVEWIVVNNQQSGYYRVNYSPTNWKALLTTLLNNATAIHEINRAQIIDDAANLARSTAFNYVPYEFFMDLTNYLQFEKSYYPWKAALKNFEYLTAMLSKYDDVFALFKAHVLGIISNTYDRLSNMNKHEDTYQDKLLRSDIISWACRMGHVHCLDNSRAMLNNHLSNETALPGHIITTMHCSAMRHNDKLWNEIWNSYLKSVNVSEKSILINGLTCTKNRDSLRILLNRTVDSEADIETGERLTIFALILDRNPENIDAVFDFVAANYRKMHELYGGVNPFSDILIKVSKGLGTDDELEKMKALIKEMRDSNVGLVHDRSIEKIFETIETNNEWINARLKDVFTWLVSRYQ